MVDLVASRRWGDREYCGGCATLSSPTAIASRAGSWSASLDARLCWWCCECSVGRSPVPCPRSCRHLDPRTSARW